MGCLTGVLRGPGRDQLPTWPGDLRVIARRVPDRPASRPSSAKTPTGSTPAFATNTATGQLQCLDARHRTQAHVEDRVKQLKGLRRPEPALDRLRPQRGMAATGPPGWTWAADLATAWDRLQALHPG